MKTAELTDAALDWAVAKCMTGGEIFQSGRVAHAVILHSVGGRAAPYFVKDSGVVRCAFEPSTNWAQGGPIIEREGIEVLCNVSAVQAAAFKDANPDWFACLKHRRSDHWHGTTPLIAAMRCFVASKLGDDIEIPEELT